MLDVLRPSTLVLVLLLSLGLPASSPAQELRVNELVASNVSTLADQDGDYSDWIELYNAGTEPIDLAGYGLSDDPSEPFQWTMPAVTIEPDAYALVFASGKERAAVAHWETVVDHGDAWRYLIDTQPGSGWRDAGFDDATWDSGPSGFGYGDGDDATTVPQGTLVTFARTSFTVDDASQVEHAVLHVDYDDGFVAHLNGTEIARASVSGTAPGAGQSASIDHEASNYQGLPLNAFEVENAGALLQDGENVLAVQVHNVSSNSSDLSLIPVFTLGFDEAPAEPRGVSDLAAGLATGHPHASFKLSSDGEAVVLTAPDSTRLDSVSFGPLSADVSFGRSADDPGAWHLFDTPTPGEPNGTGGFSAVTAAPSFSQPAGRHDVASLTVALEAAEPDTEIRYTLDGAVPTETSSRYTNPLTLSETTVVRARTFRTGYLPGPTATATYLLREDTDLPVVTIATEPGNLWDYETGIYVEGPNGGGDQCGGDHTANYWQDREIPVHVSLVETDDATPALAMDAGLKIYGGCSRTAPQKSLAIFARGRYGTDAIDYPELHDKPIDEHQTFVLRNSGNDFGYTQFRDGMMQSLLKDTAIDLQAYRPAVLFLNGEYWGIHNIREKINEHYVATNHGVAPDEIDMLEGGDALVMHGSDEHYRTFLRYLEEHDMSAPEDFDFVQQHIDVDNFIDYQIAQIYYANEDWPGNNIKFWRPQWPGGRWRWILYDTDFGFGLYNAGNVYNNSLQFATATNGPDWPNPPHSTFALRRLLLNDTFRRAFVNRFADHLNETFDPGRVVARIDRMADAIRPEMPRHYEQWNGSTWRWNSEVDRLKTFATERPTRMWQHVRSFFNLDAPATVTVNTEPAEAGTVHVSRLGIDSYPWSGQYFPDVPVPFEAVPRPGYRFTGWSGATTGTERAVHVDPRGGITLTAHFEAVEATASDVVVNEIQYNPPDDLDSEDWIELFNTGAAAIDLSGWTFADDDDEHRFVLPEGTQIADGEYLVLCRQAAAFAAAYPAAEPCRGDWDFGLSGGGDMVRLYDADSVLVDSVTFDDEAAWPTEPDGDGATLELVDAEDDNSLAESWQASYVHGGTPSVANSDSSVENERAPKQPRQLTLHPNHPNPFRDATIIQYDLDRPGPTVLRIYDVLGREVRRLVDAHQPAGSYTLRFETKDLTSGVYVVRLESKGRVQTQTATVLR